MQLADATHLLHGVVHVNGYGHLLKINGREGGSKFLSGCHIMDFWDRLCKMLRVRKMSVMDVSKKYGLEYRLFHAITSDRPWYGDWGYEFGAGSFGHTADTYGQAVKTLSNMPLASLLTYDRKPWTRLQDVVAFYMCLSEHRLATFRDLFRFILARLHSIHKAGVSSKNPEQPAAPWEKDDIQRVECAMVKILRAVGESRWVPWRALRRAACGAGPPELLDYCLKGIGGKSFDGRVVHTRCNPQTEAIEYSVNDGNAADASDSVPDDSNAAGASDSVPDAKLHSLNYITEDHLQRDLKFLYDALLNPETMLCYRPQVIRERALNSAVKLLDCKQFVKNYESDFIKIPSTSVMRVWCRIVFDNQPKDYIAAPPELLVLPVSATVADLKNEAKKAFRETYILFKRLEVEQLLDYGDVGDSTHVKFLVGFEGSVRLRGRCFVNHALNRFRMERGTEKWTVDCTCGASDDDGERMLTCDSCGVWQHTRCSGIPDSQVVPSKFVCTKCRNLPKSKATGTSKRLKCQTDDVRAVGNEMIVWTPPSFGR
eukprot:TRINITY_DN2058_c0_g1_i13.p1 TRINITY_DN2058_c0_g1~~TRINITY_DN2058_c0_g1_i13.p1  ORF type:complete len:542 (+),score=81.86 TRINITY_DN2058_c0_g1_i13:291-1916(+)